MGEGKDELNIGSVLALADRYWKWLVVLAWLLLSAWFLFNRWDQLQAFALGDTDDNMRMSQVRALLAGQDWFDLRQHRLAGSNIHWSHLVDLPLGGLILLLRPFVGGAQAELVAAALAPLLPYLVMLFGVSLTARRLIHPSAYLLAILALVFAPSANGMFMPDRLDHHGWQLALLSLAIAGLADPRRARGGATLGVATALSLAIGLELLIYLALAGAATVLVWIDDATQRRRLLGYAVTLGGGVGLSFLLFASYANRAAVCDALSPVWLSDALLGAALLVGIAWLSPGDWKRRLALAAAAGVVVAAFHAVSWPQCLQRLEGVSPEVHDLWLSHVREARPVYRHGWHVASLILALPVTGAIGWALLAWRNRIDRDLFRRTLAAAVPAIAALLLLFWQTRTGPAAQVMSVIGAAAIVWVLVPVFAKSRHFALQLLGLSAVILIGSGALMPLTSNFIPPKKVTPREIAIGKANRLCNFIGSYREIGKLPKGVVFTFLDTAPRLITVTHHNSISGPYHRNGEQIADVMNAFRGSAEQARAIVAKYRSDYLLICPNSSTTTIFSAEAPGGFYAQLHKGQVPGWLTPIELPEDSPFRIWRVAR
jgi:hypothetical protein